MTRDVVYTPNRAGLRELGASPGMAAAVLAAAERGAAAAAAADPRGRYTARPAAVTAGFRNEPRAGAIIADDGPDSMGRESTNHTLNRVAVPEIESGNR